MSSTAIAATTATPATRKERRSITGRVKIACDCMIFEGLTYQDAAAKAGLHIRSMRMALERPHVIAYLKQQKEVFRTAACSQNIFKLTEIRDGDNAMAALGAVKALEQINNDQQSAAQRVQQPGIVIVVGSGPIEKSVTHSGQTLDLQANTQNGVPLSGDRLPE